MRSQLSQSTLKPTRWAHLLQKAKLGRAFRRDVFGVIQVSYQSPISHVTDGAGRRIYIMIGPWDCLAWGPLGAMLSCICASYACLILRDLLIG